MDPPGWVWVTYPRPLPRASVLPSVKWAARVPPYRVSGAVQLNGSKGAPSLFVKPEVTWVAW